MRIRTYIFFACAGLSLLFSGCGPAKDDGLTEDGRVKVQYWEKWTGFEAEAMQEVVDRFNASQDRIFVEMLTISEIDRKLMLAISGGIPPDLAGVMSHGLVNYASTGALTPLNKYVEDFGVQESDYIPIFWEMCQHHGFTWGLPSTPGSVGMFWNKKLFREAGLDPNKPPQSIDELEAMNEQLTVVQIKRDGETVELRYTELTEAEKEAKQFRLLQIGHLPQEPGWWMPMWVSWFGGELWNGDDALTPHAPRNIEAFEWVQSYSEKYGVDNLRAFGASLGNFSSPQNPFLDGRVAMTLQGIWLYNFIDKFAPGLEWDVTAFPAKYTEDVPHITIVESDVLVIPNGAKHPREAFEFMQFVNSPEGAELLNAGHRKFPPITSVSDDFFTQHENPEIETFYELAQSPHAIYAPKLSLWYEYADEMQAAVDRILSLKMTPDQALAEVQERMDWKWGRSQKRWERIGEKRLEEWRNYDAR